MRIVLVTGANRGIGLEICKQLDRNNCLIILCSRDLNKGMKAAQSLSKNVIVKQLDVTNNNQIRLLKDFVNDNFGHLDVLINNAGVGSDQNGSNFFSNTKRSIKKHFHGTYKALKIIKPLVVKSKLLDENIRALHTSVDQARKTMETNLFGPWSMINNFVPLLKKSSCGKIINISSGMGALGNLSGHYPDYSMSKSALNALTIMYSNELKTTGIKINAVCPGWVKTDMGGPDAPLSVIEGADTAVWLTLSDEIPTGCFFKERKIIDW
jgi:NAD(P)-dependent dehydrogenase (short-subunit alcohol dehydrogenase family)